jgi:flavin reductase (DIM6/NTAB) family NADH-FMN oxidoreductase RutF
MTGFDRFVEGIDTPVLVVTATHGDVRAGCLVGFSSQVSIDPPRLLVCLSTLNNTYDVAGQAELLGVHLLGSGQHDLAERFGAETGDEVDKFAGLPIRDDRAGVVLLEGVSRRLVGRVLDRIPLGDHVGFVLEPLDVEVLDAAVPLGLRDAMDIEPGHPRSS